MQPADSTLTRLARRVVEPMGYELVGVEFFQHGTNATLRVYIDHPDGITLDDCTSVSHQLSGVLDVEDPLPGQYDLEISSPGVERPLVFPEHYARFVGQQVKMRLAEKVQGRRRLQGVLVGSDDVQVSIEVDGEVWQIPYGVIESSRLVVDW
ncbi:MULTISPECIES: ribosome maturation factor RimP [Marichromatium]|uniref:Ribosome maturation factor RimP n=1 Tax=Marichromatium gracile TaxID=1048 RepID=A0A4R4AAD9_MARGR|nr:MULTISPECIES: ribosome maturation factor RimP [Marichromatium]MBO8084915.1 ribosome maturation factor RimP [Marichromatium sp.]MBK1708880.1 ribosome maturation factor RimP [Marichromatium gracile]RNE90390.1 ribosome maturation factor RimP [Marichromatium sp. AB31]RNE94603.1 ribosome maturation factor RimP [Marichromatium sp. AB32]TCW35942.1 ribosome maturation factor RimP [Marichromatium gracile]